MSVEKVLRAFAEDNFEEDSYYPVSHGQTTLIKPLALVVKRPRSIYKRPFAKSKLIVIAVLDDYVEKEKKEEFTETKNSVISREKNVEIEEDEEEEEEEEEKEKEKEKEREKEKEKEDIRTSSHVAVKLEAAKSVKVDVKIADDLVELDLGKLDREHFKEPDLRDLLAKTALDANRMEVLEDQQLHLIYSVIYSERFILKAKHKQKVVVEGEAKTLPEVAEFLKNYAQLKGKYKKKSITPKAATRHTRGPVFFKFVRVDYDKENGRLKLSEGEFLGPVPSKERSTEADKKDYNECIVDMEESSEALGSNRGFFVVGNSLQDMTLDSGPLTDKDIKELEIITEVVLLSEKSREKRKERVKKYLNWFQEVLMTGQRKIILSDPLTAEDRNFLRRISCSVLPNQSIVDLSGSTFDTEKLQGYAILLKQINDLSDEHWDEIEKAWAEAKLNN